VRGAPVERHTQALHPARNHLIKLLAKVDLGIEQRPVSHHADEALGHGAGPCSSAGEHEQGQHGENDENP
jgi:hypothetical protein